MKWLLSWAVDPKSTWYKGILVAGVYCLSHSMKTIVQSQYFYHMFNQGYVFRHTCISVVTHHLHRMSPQARLRCGSGSLTNLITIDAAQLDFITRDIADLVDLPVHLLLSIGTLMHFLDASALWGISFLIVLAPSSFILSQRSAKLNQFIRSQTDERVKKTSESIHGIRVIKMNGWEEPMKSAICNVRKKEMDLVSKMENRRNTSELLANTGQVLSSMIVVVLQFARGKPLNASTLFPALNALATLRSPIMELPGSLAMIMEAGQILDRYRDFLLCEQYPDFRRETDEHGERVLFIQPNTKKGEIRSGRTQAEQLLIDAEEEMALDDVDNLAPSKLSPESAISPGSES
ncbi:putative ABC transporter C family member 8 [Blattamonas nauphoetae]|uniref:ABC transporter C family member 8 n=1 Tax=Blattamonas nauphoetae TaxID=2049346 RepID=A0ABQ9X5N0_9EUKA|nr:putative ABC transporter C family member 8 [Blattamonas nauphoetae]